MHEEERIKLERVIGYTFDDAALLRTALTHRSHSYEHAGDVNEDYERLEFLGDALLGFLAAEWLFHDDPAGAEGVLSRRRQSVVREATLASISQRLGLGESMRLGRGEERSGGRLKPALLADLFEAVLGAVYLDGGFEAAREFVVRHAGDDLRSVRGQQETADDYKTKLQERLQARLQRTPRYRIVAMSGPAHALRFEVEVLMDDDVLATGSGSNRKQAEQEAARAAVERLERQ